MAGPAYHDPAAEAEIDSLMRLVTEVRRFRSDQGLRPGQQVPAVLGGIGRTALAAHEASIRSLLRLTPPGGDFAPTASVLAEGVTVELDTAAGDRRGRRAPPAGQGSAAARKEAEQTERKLANESFLAKAPRRGGGQDPGPAGRRHAPTSTGSPALAACRANLLAAGRTA